MRKTLALVPLLAFALAASDINGKWSGVIVVKDPSSGNRIETPVRAIFEQSGTVVKVRIGRRNDAETESGEGKLEGSVLTFSVKPAEGTAPFRFRLVVSAADRIDGDVEGEVDSGKIAGKVQLAKDPG
jgi:hypothetical protein